MRFVVIGGGCYGTFYTRQLLQAADANAIPRPDIVVVDHGSRPRVAREIADPRVTVARAEWDRFFDHYFASIPADADDRIVPPPFTPHVALAWLLRALNAAPYERSWSIEPFRGLPQAPYAQQGENGTLNASHADWICPVHCIEPETCPHTKGPRDWDMTDTAAAFARTLAGFGQPVSQVHLFQCLHFTHGVGTYPASAVVGAFHDLSHVPSGELPIRALIGTVSRCHGTMHLLCGRTGTDTVSPRRHSEVSEPAGTSLASNATND